MIVLNDLLDYKNMKIYQDSEMFCFSLDSVMLANFVTIRKKITKIMDIGCGNAPIPLILSTKTNANIIGVEIQKEVSELAIKSVNINNCSNQISIVNDDINKLYKEFESDSFDVITCNPPYFKNQADSKKNKSEHKMIARHELFLNLEQLCLISRKLLKNNGVLAIVHRPDRLTEIISTMKNNNLEPKRIQFVYPKTESECNLILIEARKNASGGIKVLPPIYVHEKNGDYTEKIQKLFKD